MLQRETHCDVACVADNLETLNDDVRRQNVDAKPVVRRHLDFRARSRVVGNPGVCGATTIDLQRGARIGCGVGARQDVDDIARIGDRLRTLQCLECGSLTQAVRRITAIGADPILHPEPPTVACSSTFTRAQPRILLSSRGHPKSSGGWGAQRLVHRSHSVIQLEAPVGSAESTMMPLSR